MESLAGKTALVTGGAQRIGGAIALGLARAGADVVLHCRSSAAQAEERATEIRAAGRRAWVLGADLAEPRQAEELFARALEAAGAIDYLVNNASIFAPSSILAFSAGDLHEQVQVNAFAPLQLARSLAAQGRTGAIVNLLDTRVAGHDLEHAAYHLSKKMLAEITHMLALELTPLLRVNALAPGAVLAPPGCPEAHLRERASHSPLGRPGGLDGLVEALLFLLRSDFITGEILYYDGGDHLRGAHHG